MSIKRVKSYLLKQYKDKWYLGNNLFTGVIFFEKEQYQLEAFEVDNGIITVPYLSPCQKNILQNKLLDSPILIDSTMFCNEDEDLYGCGTIPQLYQGKLYKGMSYTFENGICNREIYTDEDGITDNQISWDIENGDLFHLEINIYGEFPSLFCFFHNKFSEVIFTYSYHTDELTSNSVSISYHPSDKLINDLSVSGEILNSKDYLNYPIPLPDTFSLLNNYSCFVFDNILNLKLDRYNINHLFNLWEKNNSFINVEHLSINHSFLELNNLELLNNKNVFKNLKKISFNEDISSVEIGKLRKLFPNLQLDDF